MQVDALAQIDARLDALEGQLPAGLTLFDPGWHQGVIGLVAGRIKERVHRPVVAFAPGEAGWLKGSARSVPGVHIRDVLDSLATRHPGLLERFGGHAMAAGMTLRESQLAEFERAFAEEVAASGRHGPADRRSAHRRRARRGGVRTRDGPCVARRRAVGRGFPGADVRRPV